MGAIKAGHVNMGRVLDVLEETVGGLGADAGAAGLEALHAIVYYIRLFPDKLHRPEEETHLFAAPPTGAGFGRAARREEKAAGLERLRQATRDYLDSQRRHMATEERKVLPLARERLTAADWSKANQAFAAHSDPLFGENLATGFEALYAASPGRGPSTYARRSIRAEPRPASVQANSVGHFSSCVWPRLAYIVGFECNQRKGGDPMSSDYGFPSFVSGDYNGQRSSLFCSR